MATLERLSAQAAPETRPVPPGVVTVLAIGLAAGALIKFDLSGRAFVSAVYCAVLVVLAAIDLERQIIPNRIVVPAGFAVLLGNIAAEPDRAREWTIAAVGTMLGVLLVSVATRGGIGMGDVKLAFLLGAGLGSDVVGGVVLALLAVFVAATIILVRDGLTARKKTIAFGPFLACGALLALFLA